MELKVGISNRHVHLTKNDLEILFGSNYNLTKRSDLSQIGEYACLETITIKTNKNKIDNVRILAPLRNYTQVEISKTDSYFLGIEPPVRNSGDLNNSESLTLIGPNGTLQKENCCIIASRHIHMPSSMEEYTGGSTVDVEIPGEKGGIMNNVYIKKKDTYILEMHIDTDDANAFLLKNGNIVKIKEGKNE